jgi:hypothetical protein
VVSPEAAASVHGPAKETSDGKDTKEAPELNRCMNRDCN